jgi:hypothetical protein
MARLGIIATVLLVAGSSYATTIRVAMEQPTIQEGIDAALEGDTVLVARGVYYESVEYLGKLITVSSYDPPTLLSPANGARDQIQPIRLDWTDVSGADRYQVQVDENIDFSSLEIDEEAVPSQYDISDLADCTWYYWRVRSHDSNGWDSWSTAWSFKTTGCAPCDGQDPLDPGECDRVIMTFTHAPNVGAGDSLVSFCVTLEVDQSIPAFCGGYGWDFTGFELDSAVWTPEARAVFNFVQLVWYRNNLDSTNSCHLFQTVGMSYNGSALTSTTTVVDFYGHVNNWTEGDSIRITRQPFSMFLFALRNYVEYAPIWGGDPVLRAGPTPPPAPSLLNPGDGATDQSQPVRLDWSDLSGADRYQVQLDNNSDFLSPVKNEEITTSYYDASGLTDCTLYYWRVRAYNSNGWGSWSEIWSFATSGCPPNAPTLYSPQNGDTAVSQPVALDWSDVSVATDYQVQVDSNSNFNAPQINQQSALSYYNASGLADCKLYYWRVQAYNSSGWGSWSEIWSFATSGCPPNAPTLYSPQNGDTAVSQPVALNWSDVSVATNYQVQVDSNSNFNAPQINQQSALSYYNASGLADCKLYYWRVRAYNSNGWGDWSEIWSFRTSGCPPCDDQDPSDPGYCDKVIIAFTHIPEVAVDDSLASFSVRFEMDEEINGAGGLYGWDFTGFELDSAVWTPEATAVFNFVKYLWINNSRDSTNTKRVFQVTCVRFGSGGMNTSQVVANYYGHVDHWADGDTIKITPAPGTRSFRTPSLVEFVPVWGGDAVIVGVGGEPPLGRLPDGFYLSQNRPNPFNPSTTIDFGLPQRAHVDLIIFNVLGQKVKGLVSQTLSAGEHTVVWDGTDDSGLELSSGPYFIRLEAEGTIISKKALLIR